MIQRNFIVHHIVTQLKRVKRHKAKRFKLTMMSLIGSVNGDRGADHKHCIKGEISTYPI